MQSLKPRMCDEEEKEFCLNEEQLTLPMSNQTMFVFPGAYGGAVQSSQPPQIHSLIRELRLRVGGIAATKQVGGPMFPVRSAKELQQKLAQALSELNMVASVHAQEITLLPTENIPKNETRAGGPVFRTLAHVKSTVRLIAPDTSFIDMVGSGHGGDVDDKSGGKASTYAWKDAVFKGLTVPNEDLDDTDDDSSAGGSEAGGNSGGVGSRTARGGGKKEGGANRAAGQGGGSKGEVSEGMASGSMVSTGEASDEKGLGYVLTKIAEANSDLELEQIRTAIKSGVLALHGADRLAATQAFVARKKQLSASE